MTIFEAMVDRLMGEDRCEECGNKISERDIEAYQAENAPGQIPAVCEDCAEEYALDSKPGRAA